MGLCVKRTLFPGTPLVLASRLLNPPALQLTDGELARRREELRRGLQRANAAMLGILIALVALAGSAMWQARRATLSTATARAAAEEERRSLRQAYLAQAQAGRSSGVMGRKAAGLKAVAAAAAISPSVELRNEGIAHLALLDFEPTGVAWTNTPGLSRSTIDPRFERQMEGDEEGTIHLRSLVRPDEIIALRNTNGFIHRADFSPDGRLLAVIYADTALTVWNLESRTRRITQPGVSWTGFDRQGTVLGVAGNDRWVRILDSASGAEKAAFEVAAPTSLGVFDSSGDRCALVVGRTLEIWEWRIGRRRETFHLDHEAWSLDWRGNILAVGDGAGEVHLWNLATGRTRPLQAHQEVVSHLTFNPRGDILLSTSYDGSTRVWDPFTGRLLFSTLQGSGWQFSADGQRVLFGTASGWSLWQVSKPEGYRRLDCASGPLPNVWHVDFSRDGRSLAATKENGIWLFTTGEAEVESVWFQPGDQMRATYFLPEGTNLLTMSTRRIDCWSLETDRPGGGPRLQIGNRQTIPVSNSTYLEPGTLTADRRRLALPVSRTEIALLDLERKLETARLTNVLLPGVLSFSADSRWLAAGTFHGPGTRVWDLTTRQPVQDFNEGNAGALFSPDNRYLVSAGSHLCQVFDAGTWTRVFAKPTESGSELPNRVAFSGDAALLAVVQQRHHVELHHVGGWQLATALIPPDPQVVTWLAFSPDDRQLAVATSQDLVQLWDLHVLRQRLAELGLDWNSSALVAASVVATPGAGLTGMGAWSWGGMAPVGLGALVVIACTLFIRHRQRRLLGAYLEVDQLAEQQHQQLRQAQAEVLHAQKMKALGTLAAGIAHDFNNLLSVVRMSNKLITREVKDNPAVQEHAAEIEQAVQRGKSVVRSMLGYSRETPDAVGDFSVPELVEDTVALLSKQFLSGIVLTLKLDRETPSVTGSRGRLEQILLNLVVNASEAMSGQGKLFVEVRLFAGSVENWVLAPRAADHHVELLVKDSGPGIVPEILPRIFEPFFTTKNMGTTHGTGLGLLMVYNIAQQDGLGIHVTTTLGEGSAFSVVIPTHPSTAPTFTA